MVKKEQQKLKANEASGKLIHLSPGFLGPQVGQFKQHNFNLSKYKQMHSGRSQKLANLKRMAAMALQCSNAILKIIKLIESNRLD